MENAIQYLNIISMTDLLIFLVAFVLLMSFFLIQRQRKQHHKHQLAMQSLQRDLRALANAAVGVGGRVLEIERHQRKRPAVVSPQNNIPRDVVQQAEPIAASYKSPMASAPVEYYNSPNQPYEHAIRMAQTGASTEDIVNHCGLSKSEADLVSMMHRLDKVS